MAEEEQDDTCFGRPVPDPMDDTLAEIDTTNAVLLDLIGAEQEARRGVERTCQALGWPPVCATASRISDALARPISGRIGKPRATCT